MVQRGKGGVGQYVLALVRAFLPFADRHRFVLFVLEEDLPLFAFADGAIRVVPVSEQTRLPVKNILWHQCALPRRALAEKLDVLHVPSYRRLLWPRPCPRVGTIHDLAPFHVPRKYDWKRMFYGRVVVRRLARRQEALITVSADTARDVEHFFGVPRPKISVVYNGLDHERFFPGCRERARAGVAARYGLKRPFFLYLARLEHPGKNHVRLIAAFNEFKASTRSDWELVLGGSDWHGAATIHAAARNSPFAGDIHTPGFIAADDLADLYRAADIFVYPSLHEGFGLPPLEAMACGCPVLCSARGALGEVVGDAAVVVDPENILAMSDRLAALSGSSGLRERARQAGLERAQRFDWRRTAAETLKVYESVVEQPQWRTRPASLAGARY
jgi:glycosyltransferase involved in cell wall biosynthesis